MTHRNQTRFGIKRRGLITLVCFAASLAATLTLAFASWSASAANASFRIDPTTQTVAPGTEFTVNLVVNSDTPLYGVQSTLTFDADRLEIVSLEKGTDWGTASLLAGIAPQTRLEAIAEANTTGVLRNIARFNTTGVTTPAGPKIVAVLTMRVRDDAELGNVNLSLSLLEALDGSFGNVPTSQQGGSVVISTDPPTATGTATNTATSTATATATTVVNGTSTPTPVQAATDTPAPGTATPTATDTPGSNLPGSLGFAPATLSVNHGDNFQLSVVQNLSVQSSGVVTDVQFNSALFQITDVVAGAEYQAADLTVGEAGQTKAQALAAANLDGTLRMVLVYLSDGSVVPGPAEAFRVFVTARPDVSGLSTFQLKNVTFYATQPISPTRTDALVEVIGPATATPVASSTPTPISTSVAATNTATATVTPVVATNTPGGATATNTAVVANTATHTASPRSTLTATRTNTPTATTTIGALATSTPIPVATSTPTTASAATSTPTTAAAATSTPTSATGTTPTATTAAATATTAVQGTATATATVDAASAKATLKVTPPTITAPPGAEFTVILTHESTLATSGAQADLKFDPALVQVISVEKSADYQAASLLAGVAPQKLPDAIAEANTTGTLKAVGAFFVPPKSLAAGAHEFVRIKMQVKASSSNTTTALSVANMEMLDAAGESISVAGANGQLTIQAGAAIPTPPGASSTVAGTSTSPGRLPNAGKKPPYGELNWALTISLIAMLASGGALVGSLAQKDEGG